MLNLWLDKRAVAALSVRRKKNGSYIWWHSRWLKNLKENWHVLPEMTCGIWQIFTRTLESLKIRTLVGFFSPKLKMYGLKIYSNGSWQFKVDMRNLTNFDLSTRKSQKCFTLMDCLWSKYIMFEIKKIQRSYLWRQWILMQILSENWLVFSKMTWGIGKIFTRTLESLKIGTFIGFFYPN